MAEYLPRFQRVIVKCCIVVMLRLLFDCLFVRSPLFAALSNGEHHLIHILACISNPDDDAKVNVDYEIYIYIYYTEYERNPDPVHPK